MCTVAGFYRYAEQEGLLVAATLASASEPASVSLLAINGLRVSEALGGDIEALGLERGHRTLTVLRKGGKVVTIPLAPRTARAIDLAIGERVEGPIFFGRDGQRLDRHTAWRIVRRLARKAGVNTPVGPHTLRHAFITTSSTLASRPETSKKQPATPIRARRCATTGRGSRSIVTPPTWLPPSLPAPPADLPPRQALS